MFRPERVWDDEAALRDTAVRRAMMLGDIHNDRRGFPRFNRSSQHCLVGRNGLSTRRAGGSRWPCRASWEPSANAPPDHPRHDFGHPHEIRPVSLARSLGYSIHPEEYAQDPDRWTRHRFPRPFLRMLSEATDTEVISRPTAASLAGLALPELLRILGEPRRA